MMKYKILFGAPQVNLRLSKGFLILFQSNDGCSEIVPMVAHRNSPHRILESCHQSNRDLRIEP